MSAAEGAIRRCDHPGCGATYDAAAVMTGQARADGWTRYTSRGEHYCPSHQDSPVLTAQRALRDRYGLEWNRVLADLPGRWPREDMVDLLTAMPTMSGVWRRLAVEVLDLLDAVPAGSVRIEWGHRLDPAFPRLDEFDPEDRAEVHRCRKGGRCDRPMIRALYPAVHVWRLVPTGDIPWQTGPAPEVTR